MRLWARQTKRSLARTSRSERPPLALDRAKHRARGSGPELIGIESTAGRPVDTALQDSACSRRAQTGAETRTWRRARDFALHSSAACRYRLSKVRRSWWRHPAWRARPATGHCELASRESCRCRREGRRADLRRLAAATAETRHRSSDRMRCATQPAESLVPSARTSSRVGMPACGRPAKAAPSRHLRS